jgi:flagellar FliJ protein
MGLQRLKSLHVVLSLAEQSEQQAAKLLREQRLQLESQQQQLQEITNYNQQYSQQINTIGHANIGQFISQRNFLGQLGQLIKAQSETIGVLTQQTERAQSRWQSEYLRRKKIAELIAKIEREDDLNAQKRLQKELDEMAALLIPGTAIH